MTTTEMSGRRRAGTLPWALRIVGAVLLAVMGWIHLDLWLDGHRTIALIGPAFLLNAIAGFGPAGLLPAFLISALAGFGLVVLLLSSPRSLVGWVAVLGALTAAGTLAGLLLSTTVGLFGLVETTAAGAWGESFFAG